MVRCIALPSPLDTLHMHSSGGGGGVLLVMVPVGFHYCPNAILQVERTTNFDLP